MAISKIILNGVTQIDLTSDTVATNNLIAPNTAHGADGLAIVGTATGGGGSLWNDKNVCFFGDSIGYGYNNNAHSFVDVLDERGFYGDVTKNCVSGTTSVTLLSRVQESQTAVTNADIVYAEYQANDIVGIKAGTLTYSTIATNIRSAITAIRNLNTTCSIVWMPLTIYHFDKMGGTDASYYKEWAETMYPLFAELGINLLPIYDTLNVAGHATSDQRHPNDAGHELIADLVMQMPLGTSNYPTELLSEWTGGSY